MIPSELLEDMRTTQIVQEAKLDDEKEGSSLALGKVIYPKIKIVPVSASNSGGEPESELGTDLRVVCITEKQKSLLANWIDLLRELERKLSAPSDVDLRKFALFETFKPFCNSELMMLIADTILARTKQIILNDKPEANRQSFADAIKEVCNLFQRGTNEEELMDWLDVLARKQV